MKNLIYALMVYPMTVMVQKNETFVIVPVVQEAIRTEPKLEPPKNNAQFDPNAIKLRIKSNEVTDKEVIKYSK